MSGASGAVGVVVFVNITGVGGLVAEVRTVSPVMHRSRAVNKSIPSSAVPLSTMKNMAAAEVLSMCT